MLLVTHTCTCKEDGILFLLSHETRVVNTLSFLHKYQLIICLHFDQQSVGSNLGRGTCVPEQDTLL